MGRLKAIRHNYNAKLGYERLVFDFHEKKIPRIYGYLENSGQKLYIDFFNTKLTKTPGSFGNSRFVAGLNFFPILKENLSAEVTLKRRSSIDVFYLSNPGRLVIDIKSQ